jgi:hypothetical protein
MGRFRLVDGERCRVQRDGANEVVDDYQHDIALEAGRGSVAEQLVEARAEPIMQGSLGHGGHWRHLARATVKCAWID